MSIVDRLLFESELREVDKLLRDVAGFGLRLLWLVESSSRLLNVSDVLRTRECIAISTFLTCFLVRISLSGGIGEDCKTLLWAKDDGGYLGVFKIDLGEIEVDFIED
jgi:hypothetical protein